MALGMDARGASFDFSSIRNRNSSCSSLPEQLDQCLKEMIPNEIAGIKLAWNKSITLKDHMRKRLEDCPKQVFDGAKPKKEDMVFYDRKAQSGPLMNWPEPVDINSIDYLNEWRNWTVQFACQNIHTARSSFRRWIRDTLGFRHRISSSARTTILNALIEKRNDKKTCPGIAAIPDDEWKRHIKWRNRLRSSGLHRTNPE
ncbi:MAG: hypothetical protein OXL41_10995 [Nitrospinae bacterium]|nr:hypothetical protein [Nitrospinota bacterium]